MRKNATQSLTHIFENACNELYQESQLPFFVTQDGYNYQDYFLGVEVVIFDKMNDLSCIAKLQKQLYLLRTSDAANLLMTYLVLTRPAHLNSPIYQWNSNYTCRHFYGIPLYYIDGMTPLQYAYDKTNTSNTPQDDRVREFDQICAEFARIMGMTLKPSVIPLKQRGKSV